MAALSRAKRNSLRNSVRGNRFANDCAIVGRLAVEFPSDSPIRVESYRVEDEKRRNGEERESKRRLIRLFNLVAGRWRTFRYERSLSFASADISYRGELRNRGVN